MMSQLLIPASWLYGGLMGIRNWCYDHGLLHVERCPVPVLSVGNMTAGGTGKTPFVGYLIRFFLNAGKKIAVISRGYKRSSKGTVIVSNGRTLLADVRSAGDEAYQTAKRFPAIVVIVDERRPRAAAIAVNEYHVDVIILDDGFQHRALGRDLDIVMIDGRKPLDAVPLLPSGLRREPMGGLRRGQYVVLPESLNHSLGSSEDRLRQYTDAPFLYVRQTPVKFVRLFDRTDVPAQSMIAKRCTAVCGIGNPESFKDTLLQLGMKVDHFIAFDDHHDYTKEDMASLQAIIERTPNALMVTTEKDAVKLQALPLPPALDTREWYYLEIETEVVLGENILQDHIRTLLQKAA